MTECQARVQSQAHVWQAFPWRGSASSPPEKEGGPERSSEEGVGGPAPRPPLASGPGWAAPAGNLPPWHRPLPCATLSGKPPEPPGANTEPPSPRSHLQLGSPLPRAGPARGNTQNEAEAGEASLDCPFQGPGEGRWGERLGTQSPEVTPSPCMVPRSRKTQQLSTWEVT